MNAPHDLEPGSRSRRQRRPRAAGAAGNLRAGSAGLPGPVDYRWVRLEAGADRPAYRLDAPRTTLDLEATLRRLPYLEGRAELRRQALRVLTDGQGRRRERTDPDTWGEYFVSLLSLDDIAGVLERQPVATKVGSFTEEQQDALWRCVRSQL